MKSSLKKQAERFLREQKNYKRWLAVFVCLAVVVTIGTTAALKYKGIAVTSDDSATEAMHMEQTEGNTEEIPEGMRRHVHTEACYEEQLVLVCEAAKAEAEAGETADAGTADTDTSDAGTSDTGAAAEEPGTADASQGHTHSDDCYEVTGGTEILTCTKEEHTHDGECYEVKTVTETVTKTVPETVTEEVENEDGSVSTVEKTVDKTVEETVEKEEKVLTCTKEEHTHGASCYTVEGGERTLVCGKEEGEGAAAPAAVSAEETTETAAPAAVNADADETAAPAAADAAPVATENKTAEAPAESADTEAAEAPAENADTEAAEAPAENADTETAGNTGAVSAENTETAKAPAGEHVHDDSCYEPQMVLICGKEEGELEPIEPLSDEMNLVQTAETENCIVTVTYSESAEIPEEAVLQVGEYAKDSKEYISCCEELGYQPDSLLKIGFYLGDSEIEPKKPVNVKILDKLAADMESRYDIVHFVEDGREDITANGVKAAGGMEAEFYTDSFSFFAFTQLADIYAFRQAVTASDDDVTIDVAPVSGLVHEKYVDLVTDGKDENGNDVIKYYNLTLNVKGAIATKEEKAKLDIVIVLDTSGSMAYDKAGKTISRRNNNLDEKSRRELANDQIVELVNDLDKADSGIEARYKLVTFAGSAHIRNNNQWMTGNTLKNILPDSASGGTNYEDALKKGAQAAGNNDGNTTSIVLFLTDGAPTYYNPQNYWDDGGDGSTTTTATVAGAKRGAADIASDYFFAVGFGDDMTNPNKTISTSGMTAKGILQAVTEAAVQVPADKKTAVPALNLGKFFDEFESSLKKIVASNVSFTDKLTSDVEIVNEAGTPINAPTMSWKPTDGIDGDMIWRPEIKTGEGKDATADEMAAAFKEIKYDSTNGLQVTFNPEYVLREDYTYSVTAKIKATQATTDEYNMTKVYPGVGEDNTGTTSIGKQGFYSNEEGSAELNYSYKVGENAPTPHDPLPYPRPVVQAQEMPTPTEAEQAMSHNKYVQLVEGRNDVYDLTLDVTGEIGSGTVENPVSYDVMFVVDRSTSMDDYVNVGTERNTRMNHAKKAMKNLVANLKDKATVNYKVVAFEGYDERLVVLPGHNQQTGSAFGWPIYEWVDDGWVTGTTINSSIDAIETPYIGQGTNYESGLRKAGSVLADREAESPNTKKIVIFLTDGEPNEGSQNWTNVVSTLKQYCDSFYGVGFGITKNSNAEKELSAVVNAVTGGDSTKGSVYTTTNDLYDKFNEIGNQIIQLRTSNVTVTDELSDWVEAATVDGQLEMLKVSVTKVGTNEIVEGTVNEKKVDLTAEASANTVSLTLPDQGTLKNPTMTATYDPNIKKITLDFSDPAYELQSGWTYNVTVRIKPTKKAYDDKAKFGYNAVGDSEPTKTDAPWITDTTQYISTGKDGFRTNKGASVTYTYDNKEKTENYNHPVIPVNNAKITVTKEIEGLDSLTSEERTKLLTNLKFVLDNGTEDSVEVNLTEGENGKYSAVFTDVTPGDHTVTELWEEAAVDKYSRETTVTVVGAKYEMSEISNKDKDVKVSIKNVVANADVEVEFTNKYEAVTKTIRLQKVDENNRVNDQDFPKLLFTIYAGTVSAEDVPENVTDLETKRNQLKKNIAENKEKVCVMEVQRGGFAKVVEGTVNEKYREFIKAGDETIVLPMGDYIITEDGKIDESTGTVKPLGSYYEVNPFEIHVSASAASMNDISEFPTDREVVSSQEEDGIKLTVKNFKRQLDVLQIVKISSDGRGILTGAQFDLYRADESGNAVGEPLMKGLTVDENSAKITIEKTEEVPFKVGENYILREVKAPNGYILPTGDFKFSIANKPGDGVLNTIAGVTSGGMGIEVVRITEEKGKVVECHTPLENETEFTRDDNSNIVWTLAVTNSTGAELPVTGGPGTVAYTFGGLAMIIAVSLMYGLSMRRKRGKGGLN